MFHYSIGLLEKPMESVSRMIRTLRGIIKAGIPNFLIQRRLPRCATGGINSLLLTFDDGPDEIKTPIVLKILDKYGIRAIFFLVGNRAEKFPHVVRQIMEGGHKIGNHTYAHYNDRVPKYAEYRYDIVKCQEIIRTIAGVEPRYFRPPRGIISLPCLQAARSVGLKNLFWSLEGGEWGKNRNAGIDFIVKDIIHSVKNRDILLLHDDHAYAADILDRILPALREKKMDLNRGIDSI